MYNTKPNSILATENKWSKGRQLEFKDILHYQKITKALVETERVMREIDGTGFLEGGEG